MSQQVGPNIKPFWFRVACISKIWTWLLVWVLYKNLQDIATRACKQGSKNTIKRYIYSQRGDQIRKQIYISMAFKKYGLGAKEMAADQCGSNSTTSSAKRKRCSAVLKEYRGRFYIMRRCLVILLCWHKYGWIEEA